MQETEEERKREEKGCEREKERSICCFTSQIAAKARAKANTSQEPEATSRAPKWTVAFLVLADNSSAFSGTLVRCLNWSSYGTLT